MEVPAVPPSLRVHNLIEMDEDTSTPQVPGHRDRKRLFVGTSA